MIQTFTGPLIGLYLLGMFTRRTNQVGAMFGGITGTLLSIFLNIIKVGFIWPTVYGLLTTVTVGYAVSLLTPSLRKPGGAELTWRRVMARPIPTDVEPPASDLHKQA